MALDEGSWCWLTEDQPKLANAVQQAVEGGADEDVIFRFVLGHVTYERKGVALRCKQAARYLISLEEHE